MHMPWSGSPLRRTPRVASRQARPRCADLGRSGRVFHRAGPGIGGVLALHDENPGSWLIRYRVTPVEDDWWSAGDVVRTIGDAHNWDAAKRREFKKTTPRSLSRLVATAGRLSPA